MYMIQIYLITNTFTCPPQHYVGQTNGDIDERFTQHIREGHRNDNRELSKALQKYGTINFTVQLIESVDTAFANISETEWMIHYNSLAPNGYNMKKQIPPSRLQLTEEDIEIKRQNAEAGRVWNAGIEMGKYISAKVSNSIKEKQKNGWVNAHNGTAQSPATREKISQQKKLYFQSNVSHNAKMWKITRQRCDDEYTNTLERKLGKKLYNRICSWSRKHPDELHPKLKMRVDHVQR